MVAPATVTGTPTPLSADAEVTLLRVTQEALASVSQHAHADRVAVTLSYMDGEAALDVRRRGRLPPTPAAPVPTASACAACASGSRPGGRLAVERTRPGTTIAVTVPCR